MTAGTARRSASGSRQGRAASGSRKGAAARPSSKRPATKSPGTNSSATKRNATTGKSATAKKDSVKRRKASASTSRSGLFLIDVAALRSRARRRRLVFASLLLLIGSFFAVALVQAQMVQTQSDVDRIQIEINRLENDLALLDRQVVESSSPEAIVERARRMGMVRAVRPVYLVAARPMGP